jgi:hypothetical protein
MSPSPSRTQEFGVADIDYSEFDVEEAKNVFRKLNTKTTYATQFGEPPAAAEDFVVMKEMDFKKLNISKFFLEEPAFFIQKWLKLK